MHELSCHWRIHLTNKRIDKNTSNAIKSLRWQPPMHYATTVCLTISLAFKNVFWAIFNMDNWRFSSSYENLIIYLPLPPAKQVSLDFGQSAVISDSSNCVFTTTNIFAIVKSVRNGGCNFKTKYLLKFHLCESLRKRDLTAIERIVEK